ncbi:hypothetical protein LG047_15750 [Methylocystis sp. WRRC1]|uniref:hypothetical protein n=1 Tax=Methylocystis sp. WRRC1 TaxID=1732014 RepID=UPI001D15C985|nr:hypothetical protein [Methylocystis sp. WRRC1]MCC3246753.1 hypothetical protein [Methylocystis sp. WRRC1]
MRRPPPAKIAVYGGLQLALGTVPQITGTVTNKSPYELKEMEIKVVVSDCPGIFDDIGPEAKCGIVGESKEWIYSINSPRGQKRAFKSYVSLPNLPEMKEWSWRYSIEQVIAKY